MSPLPAGLPIVSRLAEQRTAKQCGTFWQHRFWGHLIRDEWDFYQHFDICTAIR